MQIEYEIRDTDIGKGIFALSDISKGKYIWKYNSKSKTNINKTNINKTNIQLNKIYNVIEYNESSCKTHLSKLSFKEAHNFLDITYGRGELLCQIIDDGKYMNHSESPNCKTNMINGNVYAITNIKYGEQLFEDYSTFDHPTYLLPLLQKYKCVPNYYNAVFIEDLQEELQEVITQNLQEDL